MFRNSTPENDGPRSPARRKLLQTAGLLLALLTTNIRYVSAREQVKNGGEAENHLVQSLQQLASHLFPHDDLPGAQYEKIAKSLVSRASTDARLAEILHAGVVQLDEGSLTPWLMRNEARQLAAVKRLVGNEFFRLVRTTSIEHLYRNEEVWRLLGYQGSSVEFGGYVDRGFDNIDWLPDESNTQ